jgi:hypothetical protein
LPDCAPDLSPKNVPGRLKLPGYPRDDSRLNARPDGGSREFRKLPTGNCGTATRQLRDCQKAIAQLPTDKAAQITDIRRGVVPPIQTAGPFRGERWRDRQRPDARPDAALPFRLGAAVSAYEEIIAAFAARNGKMPDRTLRRYLANACIGRQADFRCTLHQRLLCGQIGIHEML